MSKNKVNRQQFKLKKCELIYTEIQPIYAEFIPLTPKLTDFKYQ